MMKQYEKYKASGVEWLGDVPEHWAVNRLKNVTSCNDEVLSEATDKDTQIEYVEIGDVDLANGIRNTSLLLFGNAPSRARRIARKGDIIVSTVRTYLKAISRIYQDNVVVSTGFAVLRSKSINSSYLSFVCSTNGFIEEVVSLSTGVSYPAITSGSLINIPVPVPSLAEQGAIARYLDYVVGRVDEVIGQKGELIERLQDKRKALINEVVTRGLDPTATTRPSGIDWLGNIPTHWEIGKLKHFSSKIGSGVTPTGGAEVYQSEGVLFIRSQNVYSDGLRIDEVAYISEDIDAAMSNSRVVNNDVLLNITGASIGRCCYVKNIGRANVNQHVCIIRPVDESLMCEYLQLVLNSDIGQIQIALAQNGGNREGLNFENLKNFIIPDISITEQKEIVTFIEERTTKIDNLVGELQGQIERLRQYKTAIISEAVTGKIDVREWQQPTNN